MTDLLPEQRADLAKRLLRWSDVVASPDVSKLLREAASTIREVERENTQIARERFDAYCAMMERAIAAEARATAAEAERDEAMKLMARYAREARRARSALSLSGGGKDLAYSTDIAASACGLTATAPQRQSEGEP